MWREREGEGEKGEKRKRRRWRKRSRERGIKREGEGQREGSLVVRVTDFSEHNASNFLSLTMRRASEFFSPLTDS